jgi:hypothetical protein
LRLNREEHEIIVFDDLSTIELLDRGILGPIVGLVLIEGSSVGSLPC